MYYDNIFFLILNLKHSIVFILVNFSGNCSAGYYCSNASAVPDQYICPPGHYCPEGTGVPFGCPNGTFYNVSGNTAVENCVDCTSGEYCLGE